MKKKKWIFITGLTLATIFLSSCWWSSEITQFENLEFKIYPKSESKYWQPAVDTCAGLWTSWDLPTRKQLRFLYSNKDKINKLHLSATWTNDENSQGMMQNGAWMKILSDWEEKYVGKESSLEVICINNNYSQ